MKTILGFILALVLSTGVSMAQTGKSPADGKSKTKVTEQKKNTPAETPGKPLNSGKKEATPAKDANPAAKGTPAKEAKPADKPAAGPLKKDGTPDMRYKSNKDAAKTEPKK
jgi:hypothetical protein